MIETDASFLLGTSPEKNTNTLLLNCEEDAKRCWTGLQTRWQPGRRLCEGFGPDGDMSEDPGRQHSSTGESQTDVAPENRSSFRIIKETVQQARSLYLSNLSIIQKHIFYTSKCKRLSVKHNFAPWIIKKETHLTNDGINQP